MTGTYKIPIYHSRGTRYQKNANMLPWSSALISICKLLSKHDLEYTVQIILAAIGERHPLGLDDHMGTYNSHTCHILIHAKSKPTFNAAAFLFDMQRRRRKH